MKKHSNKEAFYQRMQQLAEVNKSVDRSRTLGTLVSFERANDGVAYGIIKESHKYFIKKSNKQSEPDVSDFAYIGGLENVTQYQYPSLAEADKQRNMFIKSINESLLLKPNKTSSKMVLTESTDESAEEEIEKAVEKLDDLETATAAAEEPVVDELPAELPAELSAEEPVADEVPAEEPVADEVPAEEPAADEVPAEEPAADDAPSADDLLDDEDPDKEIQKDIGKLTHKIRKAELTPSQVKSYVNSYLAAFEDKFIDVEIEDRKEMANRILKVTDDSEIEDLDVAGEEGLEEERCAECGTFTQYAESRGYTKESIMEASLDEMTNLVSGYATAYGEGLNEGDFESVALYASDEVCESLVNECGHKKYVSELTPHMNALNECGEEDKARKLEELWSGLKSGDKEWKENPESSKSKATVVETGVVDAGNIEVQPNMIKEEDDDDLNIDSLDVGDEKPEPEIAVEPEPEIAPVADTLGVGTEKKAVSVDVNADAGTVNVQMNESEEKIRKYVRMRLEEKAGIRKTRINENEKSKALKKLDELIDKQYQLYLTENVEKLDEFWGGKKARFEKLSPEDKSGVFAMFKNVFSEELSGRFAHALTVASKNMSSEEKYNILKQYFDAGGEGTIRREVIDGVPKLTYAPEEAKKIKSKFAGGGTVA